MRWAKNEQVLWDFGGNKLHQGTRGGYHDCQTVTVTIWWLQWLLFAVYLTIHIACLYLHLPIHFCQAFYVCTWPVYVCAWLNRDKESMCMYGWIALAMLSTKSFYLISFTVPYSSRILPSSDCSLLFVFDPWPSRILSVLVFFLYSIRGLPVFFPYSSLLGL